MRLDVRLLGKHLGTLWAFVWPCSDVAVDVSLEDVRIDFPKYLALRSYLEVNPLCEATVAVWADLRDY